MGKQDRMILIRADASERIGSGHISRCLVLADQLRQKGASVIFACRGIAGNLIDFIEKKGYLVKKVPTNAADTGFELDWTTDIQAVIQYCMPALQTRFDWVIIDHYGLDSRWEKHIRPYCTNIAVIDDLADRAHDCDVLVDQNYYLNKNTRYDKLVPEHCRKLLGPQYALLRPEFMEKKCLIELPRKKVGRILVFFGGSDLTNQTYKTLCGLEKLEANFIIDVVVGSINPHKNSIEDLCKNRPNTNFHVQVSNMADLMAKADLAIGAGGSATWERCILGLPTITIVVADNQLQISHDLAKIGVIQNLGWYTSVSEEMIVDAVYGVINNPASLAAMSLRAAELMQEIEGQQNPLSSIILEEI